MMKRGLFRGVLMAALVCLGASYLPARGAAVEADPVYALFDFERTESFWDFPCPSDAFYRPGRGIDLAGYPAGHSPVSRKAVNNYVGRLGESSFGFGLNSAVYFRMSGPIRELPGELFEPSAADPVFIVSLADAPSFIPLKLKVYRSSLGDPAVAPNLIAVVPRLGLAFQSNTTYAAVIRRGLMDSRGRAVQRPPAFDSWINGDDPELCALLDPAPFISALSRIGLSPDDVLVATVFTTMDLTGAYDLVKKDMYRRLERPPYDRVIKFREVKSLRVHQGRTPSRKSAMVYTVQYADGTEEHTYFMGMGTKEDIIEFNDDFPHRVFELYIHTPNYQGPLSDRPYGKKLIWRDLNVRTGRIGFEQGPDGELKLLTEPEPEPIRITLLIPRDENGGMKKNCPVIIWDHGTGGSAYSPIRRLSPDDDMLRPLKVYANHGVAVVGIDGPLHGKRYETVDQGYVLAWDYFNMLNIYAFQGNLMQGGVDSAAVYHFVRKHLNHYLAGNDVLGRGDLLDPERAIKGGHSLGGIVSHMGMYMAGYDAALLSGDGEKWPLSLLDTKNRNEYQAYFGVLLGTPVWAWNRIDEFHPNINLFLTLLEPANPVNYCHNTDVPITFFAGKDDSHVSNQSTFALDRACPNSKVIMFEPSKKYDSHYCTWREERAVEEFDRFVNEFLENHPQ
jgi:hypothetical protein